MIKQFFFDGGTYGEEEFAQYFKALYRDGVSIDVDGNLEFGVTAGNGQVILDEGQAIVKSYMCQNTSAYALVVDPESTMNRRDRVVIRLDIPNKTIMPVIKKGTAASSPVPPELQRDTNIWEISLAQLNVSSSGISVIDERPNVTLCGAVRPKNLTEYNDMTKEYQRQWKSWFDSQQALGWRNVFIQDKSPEGSVAGSIWLKTY